jgi:hypothetical protein
VNQRHYPQISIRSKNELAKRIRHENLTLDGAKGLIQDVLKNYDNYWRDHPEYSEPAKNKWVRDASGTKLSELHEFINEMILKPYDNMLPGFIFGGVSGRNHKLAVMNLLGRKRKRVLLKLDIKRFYEQIKEDRVKQLFAHKCNCPREGTELLASLCCVPVGSKDNPGKYNTIGRGFATSSRLAVWCNLDTFLKLERLVKKELKGKDPRISIYVDDIGITASRVSNDDMINLYKKIKILLESDKHQKLPINEEKTKIVHHDGKVYDIRGKQLKSQGFEFLGLQMNRNKLTLGSKTRWKLVDLKEKARMRDSDAKKSRRSVLRYKQYIEKDRV